MKIKKNWWLWLSISLCFFVVWICRDLYLTYKLSVEHAKTEYELELKRVPEEKSGSIVPPVPKEQTDVWGWVIKVGGLLALIKTLLDILEKFMPKASKAITIPADVPEGTKVTVIVVIERAVHKAVSLLLSPIRLFKR